MKRTRSPRAAVGNLPVGLAPFLTAVYWLVLKTVPAGRLDAGVTEVLQPFSSVGHWISITGNVLAGLLLVSAFVFTFRTYRRGKTSTAAALMRGLFATALSLFLSLIFCPGPVNLSAALFGFYFAARRERFCPSAVGFTVVCGLSVLTAFAFITQGVPASTALMPILSGYATAGFLFWTKQPPQTASVTRTSLAAAFPLSLLSLPFFAELAGLAKLPSLTAAVAVFVFFSLLWIGAFLLIVRFLPRGWRVILSVLVLVGAGADAFTTLYGTVMTPDMVRNALATDWREATELVGLRWALRTLVFALPALVTAFAFPTVVRPVGLTMIDRLRWGGTAFAVTVLAVAFLLSQFSTLAAFMRNQKEARYLIEPPAVIYSFVRTLVSDGTPERKERLVIDAAPSLVATASDKPLLIVMVVGETVRAANWGLNGYERNTTPELKRRGVINFTDVTACGTSTDVSLPCMFSRVGRKDYDRDRILAEESVLSVIDRAGVTVRWVDNQSGCKGACTDAMETAVTRNTADCRNGVCWDRAMLGNIDAALKTAASRELLVLHSMGNHGPAYWRRTPPAFRPFGEGCLKDDLGECRPEDVVVSYDNAVAYADQFLAAAIDKLSAVKDRDTVLLYVSDHGESLGEKGLWLHGAPYWTDLSEQTKVPMILWMNDSARRRFNVTRPAGNVDVPVTHDNLADTLFELTGVRTRAAQPQESLLTRLRSDR